MALDPATPFLSKEAPGNGALIVDDLTQQEYLTTAHTRRTRFQQARQNKMEGGAEDGRGSAASMAAREASRAASPRANNEEDPPHLDSEESNIETAPSSDSSASSPVLAEEIQSQPGHVAASARVADEAEAPSERTKAEVVAEGKASRVTENPPKVAASKKKPDIIASGAAALGSDSERSTQVCYFKLSLLWIAFLLFPQAYSPGSFFFSILYY